MNHEEALRRRIKELEEQNDQLREQLRDAREKLARAKDPTPVNRPSFIRIRRLAQLACLEVSRHPHGGWVLSMGKAKQWYQTLRELWTLLTQDSWNLSDLIPDRREILDLNEPYWDEPVDSWVTQTPGWFGEIHYTKINLLPSSYTSNLKRIPPIKRDRELVKLCKQDYRKRNYAAPQTPKRNKPLLPKIDWWNASLVPFS